MLCWLRIRPLIISWKWGDLRAALEEESCRLSVSPAAEEGKTCWSKKETDGLRRWERWLAFVEAVVVERSSPLSVVAACDGGGGQINGCRCGGRLVGCSLLAGEEKKRRGMKWLLRFGFEREGAVGLLWGKGGEARVL